MMSMRVHGALGLRWAMRSRYRYLLLAVVVLVVAAVGVIEYGAAAAPASQDWPMFLHDIQRSSASTETILSPANASQLKQRWKYLTGGAVAASPSVVGGIVYVGSWDGYEYALDALTGAVDWKTFLGQTTGPCNPPVIGVTSAATVQNGVVYVGGGDSYWYALDATSGAVLWRVYTGDNSAAGDQTDGVYFQYDESTSANWRICSIQGGTPTKTTTGTAVVAGAFIKLGIQCVPGTATFFVNGVSVGTVVTNLPGAGQFFGPIFKIEKTVGGTAHQLEVDYFSLDIKIGTVR